MASPVKNYVTVEEYFLLEEASPQKHEYLEGKVIAMAGATEEHNSIVSNLIREVGSFLKGKESGRTGCAGNPFTAPADSCH